MFPDLVPVIQTLVCIDMDIVRGREYKWFPIKVFEVIREVIDHEVTGHNALAAAKNHL